jgi:hypothetical protein
MDQNYSNLSSPPQHPCKNEHHQHRSTQQPQQVQQRFNNVQQTALGVPQGSDTSPTHHFHHYHQQHLQLYNAHHHHQYMGQSAMAQTMQTQPMQAQPMQNPPAPQAIQTHPMQAQPTPMQPMPTQALPPPMQPPQNATPPVQPQVMQLQASLRKWQDSHSELSQSLTRTQEELGNSTLELDTCKTRIVDLQQELRVATEEKRARTNPVPPSTTTQSTDPVFVHLEKHGLLAAFRRLFDSEVPLPEQTFADLAIFLDNYALPGQFVSRDNKHHAFTGTHLNQLMVFLKRFEIVRAVYESNGSDAFYDSNHSEDHGNPALRISASFKNICDPSKFQFLHVFGEALSDSNSNNSALRVALYDSVSFPKTGNSWTNWTRMSPFQVTTMNNCDPSWALGGGGDEPSLPFGIDSSVKETSFHVEAVARTINSMARLPGSTTPTATSSVKPGKFGADGGPTKIARVQLNNLRYTDSRIAQPVNFRLLRHPDVVHIHNSFRWINNYAEDQLKKVLFSSPADQATDGFWDATFPGSLNATQAIGHLNYDAYPTGTFPAAATAAAAATGTVHKAVEFVDSSIEIDWHKSFPAEQGRFPIGLTDPLEMSNGDLKSVLNTKWAVTGSATAADVFGRENVDCPDIKNTNLATFECSDFEVHESGGSMTEKGAVDAIEAFRKKFEPNLRAIEVITKQGALSDLVTALGLPSYEDEGVTTKFPRFPTTLAHFQSFLCIVINEEINEELTTGLIEAASLKKDFRFRAGCSTST